MLAFGAWVQHDIPRALTLIRTADLVRFPLYQAVAALIYTDAGLSEAAVQARHQALAMAPWFFQNFIGELEKRNFSATDLRIVLDGAERAGFPVPAVNQQAVQRATR